MFTIKFLLGYKFNLKFQIQKKKKNQENDFEAMLG